MAKQKSLVVRTFSVLTVLFLMLALFVGCGGDATDGGSNAGTANNGSNQGSVQVPSQEQGSGIYAEDDYDPYSKIPESSKGVTVRYATWIDHTTTEGAKPLGNFYDDTGIRVTLYLVPQNGYVNTLMTKMASGDIPDVYVTSEDNQSFPLSLQIGAPIDLVSTVDLNDPIWDKSMLETGKIGDHYYLLNTLNSPWSGSNLVYYNKSIFEANGFKTPADYYAEGNWTWNTMKKVMKEVDALGEDYIGGYVDPEILGGSAGVSFVNYDYKSNKFSSMVNSRELLSTYQFYADLRTEGLVTTTLIESIEKFKNGRLGIMTTGVYGLKATGHFVGMDQSKIGYTYLPALEDGTKGLTSSIHRMYGICAKAPNADAAGYFIRYWLDYKNYDLESTFISIDAGNFYYELINQGAENKYFNFDFACANLIGHDNAYAFTRGARTSPSAGTKTAIDSVSNLVDDAVKKANALIESTVKDQANYK